MDKGMLVQPYVQVLWADMNLSAYDNANSGEKDRVVQNVSLKYTKDDDAPTCDFDIVGTPDGFEVVQRMRESDDLFTETFDVEMGFPHLPDLKMMGRYIFAGLDVTTGLDPMVNITVVSAMKSSFTDNKVSFTMEEEVTLEQYAELLKEKAGAGGSLIKYKWVGQAAEDCKTIMIKNNVNSQTPMVALAEMAKEHGIEVRTMDTSIDGTIVLGYPINMEGEAEADKPQLDGEPESGVRRIHILGPGLIDKVTRKQSFNLGQSDTSGAAKNKATSTTETEQKKTGASAPADAAVDSKNTEGITGTSDKSKARSGTTKDSKNKEKAKQAATESGAVQMDATFPMVPQVVGMKPGDMLAIPSIKGPGDYIEDFEIQSVEYKQDATGGVYMSISGHRPTADKENLLDAASVAEVKARVATLRTVDAWQKFYWRQGPDVAWPLYG